MNSPFRTGSTVRYQIEVIDTLGMGASQQEIMDGIRYLCADLIEGIDQQREGCEGPEAMDHTSIYVEPMSVGEAVRRINEYGYATDEDEQKEDEEV
ncbi:MAG: hypothetical protein ABI324_21575 [Ktedonobacteraceae bacterium]